MSSLNRFLWILAAIVAFGAGCARTRSAKQAHAPSELIKTPQGREVADYPAETLSFESNQLFMWNESPTGAQLGRVLEISLRADVIADQTFELKSEIDTLSVSFESSAGEPLPSFELRYGDARDTAKIWADQVAEEERELSELEKKQPRAPEDDERIAFLKGDIEANKKEWESAQAVVEGLLKELEQKGAHIVFAQIVEKRTLRDTLNAEAEGLLKRVADLVDIYQPPSVVEFKLHADGVSFSGAIKSLDLKDGSGGRDYTTDNGGIKNLVYSVRGGTFEFELVGGDQATYHFKISRARPEAKDGRPSLKGKVFRTDASGKVREGVAKFGKK